MIQQPCRCCPRLSIWALVLTLGLIDHQAFADTGELKVRVLDDTSGQVIPARLVLQTSDGKYPGDRLGVSAQQWPNIEAHGVFSDGDEIFEVPAGATSVTAAHGLEYQAASTSVNVQAGERASIELRLKRLVNMRKLGWVAGDLHIHMIHGENQRKTSYEDVALTSAANGLDFVSVGQEYVGAGSLDLAGYQAKCREVSTNSFTMFLGGERPKNILGHQVLLGCENPFVISEEPPYFNSAHAVHAQGGIIAYVHPLRYFPSKKHAGEWLDFPGNNLARELIFDAYAGPAFDAISVLSDDPGNPHAHQLWFNLLNRGLFVPAIADSDACFDRPTLNLHPPGFWNTYFYLGPEAPVTQKALSEAVRKGRTMATTGPLIQFRMDGQLSGATLPLDGKPREVTIEAHYPQHAFSLETTHSKSKKPTGIAKLELIRNGQVVKLWEPNDTQCQVQHTISESQPCWYAVRALGTDERWQVALASPIYFAEKPVPAKREPLATLVRGRIYDFTTGKERKATVEVRRNELVLRRFEAIGQFLVRMPIDAEIIVQTEGTRPIRKNLLLDYGPIHRFLWYLESSDMGNESTLDRFEMLARSVDLEFPLDYRMPGCFIAKDLTAPVELDSIEVVKGPEATTAGTVAVAAILTDVEQIAPGDEMHVAVLFRDEGAAAKCGPYVVEARGYDPAKPTGFGALKKFASFEKNWDTAQDVGSAYKLIAGKITVPDWVTAGPAGFVDLSVRARQKSGDAVFVGLAIPLAPTKRALTLSNSWPTVPHSWPDRMYGIGPLRICNRLGRKGQTKSDYRQLQLTVLVNGEKLDLLPSREGRGCADAEDAMYTTHCYDQVLNEESRQFQPEPVRPQPLITLRDDLPVIEALRP